MVLLIMPFFGEKINLIYCPNEKTYIDRLYKYFTNQTGLTYVLCPNITLGNDNNVYLKLLDNKFISNKRYLWESLNTYYGKKTLLVTPKTYIFPNDYESYKKECEGKKMIFKTNSHRQEGLFVTNMIQSSTFIEKEKFIVAQRFMDNAYTYKNKKISCRLYLFIKCYKNNIQIFIFNDGLVYYSSNENKDVASFYDSKKLYDNKYPMSINKLDKKIFNSLYNTTKMLIPIIKKHVKCDSNYRVELFGVDFHITKDYKSFILEVNSGPGMTSHNKIDDDIRNELMKSYNNILKGG